MNKAAYLWAKTPEKNGDLYHPLLLHLIDVAACADTIIEREPESTKDMLAKLLGFGWPIARPWFLFLIACHDIGKACPGFQLKWEENNGKLLKIAGFHIPKLPDTTINHAYVSQYALEMFLIENGWEEELANLVADAIGCHHGVRATPTKLDKVSGNRNGVDEQYWKTIWIDIFSELSKTLGTEKPPVKKNITGPEFMLLAGLTSFADWIGSNEEWFPFGHINDCDNLVNWFKQRKIAAEKALNVIGWHNRTPLITEFISFEKTFPKCSPPRPLQTALADIVQKVESPCVLLIEAPMGEGKTEAAFYAHLELQRKFGHRGLYIAMPTKATGNAMFSRTYKFLKTYNKKLDLQLLHGSAELNDDYNNIRLGKLYDDEKASSIQAGVWFTNKKRALLSEYGVGTIDQALITILPVKHYFVRLWGLANRVVIFDEIHTYDAYTGTLLFHLIKWLRALGSSVILLSATLTPEFRRKLAAALDAKIVEENIKYPRLTCFSEEKKDIVPIHFPADISRKREIIVKPISETVQDIKTCLENTLNDRGYAGIIVNTVQRAQELYQLFGQGEEIFSKDIIVGKRLKCGTEIYLLHARIPANNRQIREKEVLSIFGKNEIDGKLIKRTGKRVLIATQVAEQSLDLDFDLLITDIAPIDLVLQRAGRLWRHNRDIQERPFTKPLLCIAGLSGATVCSFDEPLWWNKIYREDILYKTWSVLRDLNQSTITLPDDIDPLVVKVYEDFQIPDDEELIKKIEKAEIEEYGVNLTEQNLANQVIIGLPDDESWQQTTNIFLYDDDEPGIHPSLLAKTRLGEDSVTVIPLFENDSFCSTTVSDFSIAKELVLRAVSLSRKCVVRKIRSKGIPESWKKSTLLRNCYPMSFDKTQTWIEDTKVKIDNELGIVYREKEE